MCVCVYVCVCVREREREREKEIKQHSNECVFNITKLRMLTKCACTML